MTRTGVSGKRPAAVAARGNKARADEGYRPVAERRAAGKALREAVPRSSHRAWVPPPGRQDPVELLLASSAGRLPQLVPIRFARMAQSPFTFYRGGAALMAADLAATPVSGPRVQACGDAHLMNFGGFATPERNLIFDINDLDETLPAPWEWDVKRLAASLVIAARDLRLTADEALAAARDTVRSYRERMDAYAGMRALEVWYDRIDLDRVMKSLPRERDRERLQKRLAATRQKNQPEYLFPKLVEHRGALPVIKDEPPLIFHPTAAEAPGLRSGFRSALAQYRASLPEHVALLFDRFRLADVAIKVVGIGSVGTHCSIALLMADDHDPLFLQVKQALPSVLAPHAGPSRHANQGQRVVAGARLMQAASDLFLGWLQGENGKHFYVRQLRDMKISALLVGWDFAALQSYGRLCGWALARAHARSGDAAMLAGYLGQGATFDEAVADFAVAYAEQNERDYMSFVTAIREGRVPVAEEM